MMKRPVKLSFVFILLLLAAGLSHLYIKYCSYPKSGEAYRLYLNPFRPDQESFEHSFTKAEEKLSAGDTAAAIIAYRKALGYRGTFNEKQRSYIYSDGMDYWKYTFRQLLLYARCYEITMQPDSAIACLAPALMIRNKQGAPIEKRYFELLLKKYGAQTVRNKIEKGLNTIHTCSGMDADCYDHYYFMDDLKIGLAESDAELAKTDKEALIRSRYRGYGI